MTWPDDRIYDVADGGPITHTLANALQDAIINAEHGKIWVPHGVSQLVGPSDSSVDPYWEAAAAGAGGYKYAGGAANGLLGAFEADFPLGTKIYQARVYVFTGSGVASRVVTIGLRSTVMTTGVDAAITAGAWATDTSVTPINQYDTLLIGDPVTPQTLVAGTKLYVQVDADTNNRVFGIDWQIGKG